MFFYITQHAIAADRIKDGSWFDPFNKRAELFQTYRLCALDPLIEATDPSQRSTWARHGFSVRGGPRSGTSFGAGDKRIVVDPQITFSFPDGLLGPDQRARFRFDLHFWETDNGKACQKVRTLFTDATLDELQRAWKAANEDRDAAAAALGTWFDENWQEIASALIAAANPAAAGVVSQYNLLELTELLFDVARNQGVEYHGSHRFVFEIETDSEAALRWRVVGPSEASDWVAGEGRIDQSVQVVDAGAENDYTSELRFRVLA